MEWNFSPENSREAWRRILISILFSWIFLGIGLFLDINGVFMLSNLFFIFVGLLAYMLIDGIIYLFVNSDFGVNENKLIIVGSVMGFLVNLIIFYGLVIYI